MASRPSCLGIIGIGVAIVAAAVASFATWMWVTIPPDLDPNEIPALALEPPAQRYQLAVSEGRSLARRYVAEEKLPGLSVAVAIGGDIVWAEGFRYADMGAKTPVTPRTVFRVGGVTKALTSAAIGLLVQRGELDLDEPIQNYVPEFPEHDSSITVRQLMGHTAGLRGLRGDHEYLRRVGCQTDEERLELFKSDPLVFPPGTESLYSTWGWVLIGMVVGRVAGEDPTVFIEREVLEPLGMDHTTPFAAGAHPTEIARFYYPRMGLNPRLGLQDAPPVDLTCILSASGYLSTPSDLVRLGSALLAGNLLEATTVELLLEPVTISSGEPTGQGLGWEVGDVSLGDRAAKTHIAGQGLGDVVRRNPVSATSVGGHVSGGTAALLLVPEHHIAIAVASNVSAAVNVAALTMGLADILVGTSPVSSSQDKGHSSDEL